MNKEEFIKRLSSITGLDNNKTAIVNDILENHFIVGKKNKEKIILDIEEQLKISRDDAEKIYESAMSIIGNGIKDKLKHPFKNID